LTKLNTMAERMKRDREVGAAAQAARQGETAPDEAAGPENPGAALRHDGERSADQRRPGQKIPAPRFPGV